jgi:hypothetical protein
MDQWPQFRWLQKREAREILGYVALMLLLPFVAAGLLVLLGVLPFKPG